MVGQRLSRLSPGATVVLHTAAVLGDGFTVDVLTATTEQTWAVVTDAVEERIRTGMLDEPA